MDICTYDGIFVKRNIFCEAADGEAAVAERVVFGRSATVRWEGYSARSAWTGSTVAARREGR